MKEWWFNLALREKQTVFFGGIAVVLFLGYALIWAPLADKNDTLRNQIQHNRELLNWMESANLRITDLQKSMQTHIQQRTGSLLSIVQTTMNKSPLAAHMNQLHQADSDSVQFNLRNVDFDEMIVLLNDLWKQHGLITSQITVNPTGKPGEVNVNVVLH